MLKSQRRESGQQQEVAPMPTFAEAQPVWKKLSDRVGELAQRRNAIHDELNDLETATAWDNPLVFRDTRNAVEIHVPPHPKPTLSERVNRLLGEFKPAPEPPPEPKEPVRVYSDPFMARKVELSKELQDIEAALEVLHPQLVQAHQKASRAHCETLAPQYRERASRVLRALTELGAACVEHQQYIEGIKLQGCDPAYFRPVDDSRFLGDPRYGMPALRDFLNHAAELGHINQAEVEAALPAPPVPSAYTPPPPPLAPHTAAVKAKLSRLLPSRRRPVVTVP